jgi:hypothetical protein
MQVNSKLIVACCELIFTFFQVMSDFLRSHHGKDIATVAVNPFVWDGGASISSSIFTAEFDCSKSSQINVTRKVYIYPKVILQGLLTTPKKRPHCSQQERPPSI